MTGISKHRTALKNARRVVVKAGSKVLVESSGRPDEAQLRSLISSMTAFHRAGREVAFVSSGAIGAGLEALGLTTRPKAIPDLQMAAAVGQIRLMSHYDELFSADGVSIGQVLLTHDVLRDRERHLNARNTLLNLIANGIVPIINENDAVSSEEIKFGDNDVLAALVAILIDADALVLLSTTDGLRDAAGERVSHIEEVDEGVLDLVRDKADKLSTGGMASKLKSAQIAASNGVPVVIADGRVRDVLSRVLAGEDEGTLLFPKESAMSKRKRWIAFFNKVEGAVVIDDGAVDALRDGNSLLPVGVKEVKGEFDIGALVEVRSTAGQLVARGLVECSNVELNELKGCQTEGKSGEVIHRDNLVSF